MAVNTVLKDGVPATPSTVPTQTPATPQTPEPPKPGEEVVLTPEQIKAKEEAEEAENRRRDWKSEAKKNADEAQKLREDRRKLQEELDTHKREKMTEGERLAADLKKATDEAAQLKLEVVHSKIVTRALLKGFHDPEDAVGLIESKIAEGGTNIDALLDELVKAKPYLIKTTGDNRGINKGGIVPNSGGSVEAAKQEEVIEKVKNTFPLLGRMVPKRR